MSIDASSWVGQWFVAPFDQPTKGARVIVSKPEANGASTVGLSIRFGHKPAVTATAADLQWREDMGRASLTLRSGNSADKPRQGWLMPSGPRDGDDSWIGGALEGGPLLRAQRLSKIPETLGGHWTATTLGERAERRTKAWTVDIHPDGDVARLKIARRHKTVDSQLLALNTSPPQFLSIDAKGVALRLRLWPLAAEQWLVGEAGTGVNYLLHRDDAEPKWPTSTNQVSPRSGHSEPDTDSDATEDEPSWDPPPTS